MLLDDKETVHLVFKAFKKQLKKTITSNSAISLEWSVRPSSFSASNKVSSSSLQLLFDASKSSSSLLSLGIFYKNKTTN